MHDGAAGLTENLQFSVGKMDSVREKGATPQKPEVVATPAVAFPLRVDGLHPIYLIQVF
jgi:hypothetical protein